jgi:hypothetical protein
MLKIPGMTHDKEKYQVKPTAPKVTGILMDQPPVVVLNIKVWQQSTDNAHHTDHGAVSDL